MQKLVKRGRFSNVSNSYTGGSARCQRAIFLKPHQILEWHKKVKCKCSRESEAREHLLKEYSSMKKC